MLEDPASPIQFQDVWFNSYDHLCNSEVEAFGAIRGERLTAALRRLPSLWPHPGPSGARDLRPHLRLHVRQGGKIGNKPTSQPVADSRSHSPDWPRSSNPKLELPAPWHESARNRGRSNTAGDPRKASAAAAEEQGQRGPLPA
jgi:hypothetical protein